MQDGRVCISPEENSELDALVTLSGMTKQDYCISRILQRDVVVTGNPRVHKALKVHMEQICREFSQLCSVNDVSAEALHVMEYLTKIYKGLEN